MKRPPPRIPGVNTHAPRLGIILSLEHRGRVRFVAGTPQDTRRLYRWLAGSSALPNLIAELELFHCNCRALVDDEGEAA